MSTWEDVVGDLHTACRDAYGVPVIFTPAGGDPETITGIFEAAREIASIDAAGIPVALHKPVLEARLADFSIAPKDGDGITVKSVVYAVTDVQPDGHGWVALVLKR